MERSDKGFDLQVPLTNHSDQAGLYHVHVYGVEANEQTNRPLPSHDQCPAKDLASSQPKITITPISSQEFEVDLKLFEDVDEIVFPSGLKKMGRMIWSGIQQRRSHLVISNCAFRLKKDKRSGLFHLHIYQKARDN